MNGSYIPYAYRWAVTQATPLGKIPLAVLVTLISYMDMKDKICFPSRRLIAAQIYGVDPPEVARWQQERVREALSVLEANELVLRNQELRHNGSKTSSNYEILIPNAEDVEHPLAMGGISPHVEGGSSPQVPGGVSHQIQGGGTPGPGGDHKYPFKSPNGSVQKEGSTRSTSSGEGSWTSEQREQMWQQVAGHYWQVESQKPMDERMSIRDFVDMHLQRGGIRSV